MLQSAIIINSLCCCFVQASDRDFYLNILEQSGLRLQQQGSALLLTPGDMEKEVMVDSLAAIPRDELINLKKVSPALLLLLKMCHLLSGIYSKHCAVSLPATLEATDSHCLLSMSPEALPCFLALLEWWCCRHMFTAWHNAFWTSQMTATADPFWTCSATALRSQQCLFAVGSVMHTRWLLLSRSP